MRHVCLGRTDYQWFSAIVSEALPNRLTYEYDIVWMRFSLSQFVLDGDLAMLYTGGSLSRL